MFCYAGYTVVLCLVMWVCNFLIFFCTDMFLLLKWHQGTQQFTVFIPTPTVFTLNRRTQPTHSAPLSGYYADDPQHFLHPWHTHHRKFLALTMHYSQSVSHNTSQPSPIYLYMPPTQSTHVFSYDANDPKRFLKLYSYYPVYCILLSVPLI